VRALFLKSGVFDAQNLVTIPEARLIHCTGTLRPEDLAAVENAVRAWLGL
jgi:mRNA interferase MazF